MVLLPTELVLIGTGFAVNNITGFSCDPTLSVNSIEDLQLLFLFLDIKT